MINRKGLKGAFKAVSVKLDYRDPTLGPSGASGKGRSGIEHWVVFIILLILIGALLYALGFNMNGLR